MYKKNPDGSWMNLDRIVEDIIKSLPPEDKQFIATLNESDLGQLHHFAGMQIRNMYGLWQSDHPLTERWVNRPETHDIRDGVDYSEDHPDQVSSKIIHAVWSRIHP